MLNIKAQTIRSTLLLSRFLRYQCDSHIAHTFDIQTIISHANNRHRITLGDGETLTITLNYGSLISISNLNNLITALSIHNLVREKRSIILLSRKRNAILNAHVGDSFD